MGVELELGVLLALSIVGQSTFARFEIETSRARLVRKWFVVSGLTLTMYYAFGHWALTVPLGLGIGGGVFHYVWCKRNNIHPLNATPRDQYYRLRGWTSGSEWAAVRDADTKKGDAS